MPKILELNDREAELLSSALSSAILARLAMLTFVAVSVTPDNIKRFVEETGEDWPEYEEGMAKEKAEIMQDIAICEQLKARLA